MVFHRTCISEFDNHVKEKKKKKKLYLITYVETMEHNLTTNRTKQSIHTYKYVCIQTQLRTYTEMEDEKTKIILIKSSNTNRQP